MKKIGILTLVLLSALGQAQQFDDLGGKAKAQLSQSQLAEVEVNENRWQPHVSNAELVARLGWLLGKHGIELGPDTAELLREVQDAEIRSSERVRGWMKDSSRHQKARIEDATWRLELVTSGSSASHSDRLDIGRLGGRLESGSSTATLQVKAVHLPSMRSKVFAFEAKYSSSNLEDFDLRRNLGDVFRRSGLPEVRFSRYERESPEVRRGFIAIAKLWSKVNEGLPEIIRWMDSVSARTRN